MRRRDFLALSGTGLATTMAGCFGVFSGGGGTPTATDTPTMSIPEIQEAVDVTSSELVREDEDTFAESVGIVGAAVNTTERQLASVELTGVFLDENGEELQRQETSITNMGPDREWTFRINFSGTGSDARAVADYEVIVGGSVE